MSNQLNDISGAGLATETAKPKLKKPRMFKVVLLNDDYTPMVFVVLVLQSVFRIDREKAEQIALHVHTSGKGVCGVFTKDIAETKVSQVKQLSQDHQHPLLCVMEEA